MPHHDLRVAPVLRRLSWLAGAAVVALSLTAYLTYQGDRQSDQAVVAAFHRARLGRDIQALAIERDRQLGFFGHNGDSSMDVPGAAGRRSLFAKLDSLTKFETPLSAEDSVVRSLRSDLTIWDAAIVAGADSTKRALGATLFQSVRDRFAELREKEDLAFAAAARGDPWVRTTWVWSLVVELILIVAGAGFTYRMLVRDVAAVMESQAEVLDRLAAAGEYRDDSSGKHTWRVGELAGRIARTLGMSEAQAATIRRAAALHDIGKIGLPDELLLKRGKLTPEEFELMREHTLIGARILGDGHSVVVSTAARIARSHHERWDGTGYPDRLAGNDIPLEARITAVADVFDAIRSKRPYRNAWALEVSLDEIRHCAGTQFDPNVVKAFFDGRCYEGYAVEGGDSQDAGSGPLLIRQLAKLGKTTREERESSSVPLPVPKLTALG